MRSTPTRVAVTARVNGRDPVVTVFSFQGRRIVTVPDYPSMKAAEAALDRRRWWRRWQPGSRG